MTLRTLLTLTLSFSLIACSNISETLKTDREVEQTPQSFNQQFSGEHAALAKCVVTKLQSDGKRALNDLQFKHKQFSDKEASEVLALDTRYLSNVYPAYAPSNPDAVKTTGDLNSEMLSSEESAVEKKQMAYTFSILLEKNDYALVMATLDGDRYTGAIGWKILESCAKAISEQPANP